MQVRQYDIKVGSIWQHMRLAIRIAPARNGVRAGRCESTGVSHSERCHHTDGITIEAAANCHRQLIARHWPSNYRGDWMSKDSPDTRALLYDPHL